MSRISQLKHAEKELHRKTFSGFPVFFVKNIPKFIQKNILFVNVDKEIVSIKG
jgi:hypothetical protein